MTLFDRLLEKRRLLIDVFKRQTYGYLYAQRLAAQARMKSAERPKGVLIKYRELLRTAASDEATLTKVGIRTSDIGTGASSQGRSMGVDLQSNPSRFRPIAPRKKRIVALGLIAGLVAGEVEPPLFADRAYWSCLQRGRTQGACCHVH